MPEALCFEVEGYVNRSFDVESQDTPFFINIWLLLLHRWLPYF